MFTSIIELGVCVSSSNKSTELTPTQTLERADKNIIGTLQKPRPTVELRKLPRISVPGGIDGLRYCKARNILLFASKRIFCTNKSALPPLRRRTGSQKLS